MQFWEDASPATKGTVIVGGLLVLYLIVANLVGIFPYAATPGTTRERVPASAGR